MNHDARHPPAADEEFEVVQPRHVAMPALLWALSMLVVVIATVVGTAADPVSAQAAEPPPGLILGA